MSNINEVSSARCFDGEQKVFSHRSEVLDCEMKFGIYLPPQAVGGRCPVLYWLSGLTCTEDNFINKAGAQQHAARHGIIVVAPDTSPRGEGVADDAGWDLGCGAGFYVNATQEPWSAHYRMYDYVASELPSLIEAGFAVTARRGIFGHSMGGHGALTVALKNPGRYVSVSAFAPIVAPTRAPWGQKAFGAYLGDDEDVWKAHDATCLVAAATERLPILIDQGGADDFLDEQLRPQLFKAACEEVGQPLELRIQPGYDHSYYFIATFIGEHITHHFEAMTR